MKIAPPAFCVLLLSVLCCGTPTTARERARPLSENDQLTRFEEELEDLRAKLQIPALSAALIKDQKVWWSKGLGYADIENKIGATPDTNYRIASLTKTFASTLLLQLAEQGRLDLDEPMARLAPSFQQQFGDEGIRVRHVLTHTSHGTPGHSYRYDGRRFSYLTEVIEKATGIPFREVLVRNILDKIEMNGSVPGQDILDDRAKWPALLDAEHARRYERNLVKLARPYRVSGSEIVQAKYPPRGLSASAGLISNVTDLAKYDAAIDRHAFVKAETQERAWTPAMSGDGRPLPYGLGWFVQRHQGLRLIWHYGYWPDSFSSLYLKIPEKNLSLILLANSDGLSAPFRLGDGDVTRSAFADAFLRHIVFRDVQRDRGSASRGNIPRWGLFEAAFTSTRPPDNPFQDVELRVTFTAPSRRIHTVRGFWDGGATWRVRFSPDETGTWTFTTQAAPESDGGLHAQKGTFRVTAAKGGTRFDRHGPIRVSRSRTFLEHADGTPFFWLADTGWNAALLSTPEEFEHYLAQRARQRFTAVQWVTTQWRASPQGDRLNELAFTGTDRIAVNPAFFQRLDAKMTALNRAGLLSAPVMLWAIGGGSNPAINPGFSLPEDQAIRLAQYMVARWQAHDVLWILPGDGDYRGEKAEKWKRIGRAVFGPPSTGSGQTPSTGSGQAPSTSSGQAPSTGSGQAPSTGSGQAMRAPVVLHPGGMHWVLREFQHEPWLDVHGYQSGHGDDDKTLRWMTEGPPTRDWRLEPTRPFINLEPPYENHVAYQSRKPIQPLAVRRAVYWSLLNAPTAGVSYGGHGVWGWDDGTRPPTDHAGSGVPLPWKQALVMPAAEHMAHVAALFASIDFWRLRPAPDVLSEQPGADAAARFIMAAASPERDLLVIYTPEAGTIAVNAEAIRRGRATWHNPRTGERTKASGVRSGAVIRFATPADGDWVLVVMS